MADFRITVPRRPVDKFGGQRWRCPISPHIALPLVLRPCVVMHACVVFPRSHEISYLYVQHP
jgi:hypothetical protein